MACQECERLQSEQRKRMIAWSGVQLGFVGREQLPDKERELEAARRELDAHLRVCPDPS